MDKIIVLLFVTALFIGGAACGGSDACEEASDKQKSCINKLECKSPDPLQQSQCEQQKKALLQAADLPAVACTGDLKARAEQILACDLDPKTCVCPR